MNFQNPSFVRKIIYLTAIAVLLLPIAYLSQPASASRGGSAEGGSPGGKLAQLRARYNLSQAELGEIDPASETMKLATVGLRGVAVNALWLWGMHYQKIQDFNNLELTVKQIIRLQPNFLKVWDFQAHNLSYNTSIEFDNYRHRYEWVKKGIDFLILGTQYNRDEPGLLNSIGWFVGQKMGRSDENRQFRRLFKDDKDFHDHFRKHGVEVDYGLGPDGNPDSWLVSKLWYDRAEEAVAQGKPLRLKAPLLFYASAPMSLINAASAMEKDDGVFGQKAQVAWENADEHWSRYGNREILTSAGFPILLKGLEERQQAIKQLENRLDALVPGAREKLRSKKIAALKPEDQAIIKKPREQMTPEESARFNFELRHLVAVAPEEIAPLASRENRSAARDVTDQMMSLVEVLRLTALYRDTVNYAYWQTRCEAEQQQIALEARELVHRAERERISGAALSQARQDYEAAWDRWAVIFDKYPDLIDGQEGKELVESISHYRDLLSQLEVDFPGDFKLNKLLDVVIEGQALKRQIEIVQGRSVTPTPPEQPQGQPATQQPPGGKDSPDKEKTEKIDEKKEPAADAKEKEKGQPAESKDKEKADAGESGQK